MSIVARMFANTLRKLEPVVRDHGVQVTYCLYTGVGSDLEGNPEDQFFEFGISLLRGNSGGWTTTPEGRIRAYSTRDTMIGLEKDLPDGVTLDDMSNNDKIVIGSKRFDVSNYRPVKGLVFRLEIEGG